MVVSLTHMYIYIFFICKELVLKCQKILYYFLACDKYEHINKNFFESDHSYCTVGALTISLKFKNI